MIRDPDSSKSKQFARRFAPVAASFRHLISVVAARLWNGRKPLQQRYWLYAQRALVLFFLTSFTSVLFYRWLPIGFTPLMILRVAESTLDGKPVKWRKDWVSIEEISSRMQAAVIAAEDQYFFEHKGVDWKAIEKAVEHNRKSRRTRGASTITQQVAKNVFLWPDRSWIRKGLELYFTGLIEVMWTKERILEVYLNVVELGDGVYGVEAAAKTYFHKPAAKLNADESSLLAASLPNPRKLSVSNPSGYLRFRQSLIRRRLSNVKLVHLEREKRG